MNDVQKRVSDLSPQKLALLSKKLKEGEARASAKRRITPRGSGGENCPLSFAQQRLWFIDQLEPGNALYHIPQAARLKGELSIAALSQSLTEVIRRHEVLRTRFPIDQGAPAQVITPVAALPLLIVDLSGISQQEQDRQVSSLARQETHRPFDLSEGPLLRTTLIYLKEQERVLLMTMHHIVSDGWSIGILVKEFFSLYRAYRSGERSPLAELSIQYGDFSVWQRGWLGGEVLTRQVDYWRNKLKGLTALNLPTDYPRPKNASHRGGIVLAHVPPALTENLRRLSRRQEVTLFMTLLAAFQTLLGRYANQQDVAVGTDIANRNHLDTEELIGFFINQLVMRTEVRGSISFRDLLAKVRQTVLGAYEHQDLPFEKLVEELQPERDLSRAPLFQVKLVLQNIGAEDLVMPGLELMEFTHASEPQAKYDLTLMLAEVEGGLSGIIEYAADLYHAETIERMIGHFMVLLQSLVADPQRAVSDLGLLTDGERAQLLIEWNDTAFAFDEFACAQELMARQAEMTPESIAVVYEEQHVSYWELNERANSVGNYLRVVGVGPEVVVGLCLTRRPELLIALLGVLKAGGAYLPLNPNYPVDRLAFMLDDSRAVAVLTHAEARDRLPALWLQVISLDQDWQEIERAGRQQPVAEAGEENAAYIIYTSGSTGRPKGVVVTHRGLSNYLRWASEAYEVSAGGACPVHSPVGFDLTVTSLLTPLSCGGRVELLREGHDVETLRLLTSGSEQYALIKATPSHLPLLEELAGERVVGEMSRWLVLGGEALRYEDLASWREAGGVRIVNEYGPTETVVGCCVYEVCEDSAQSGGMPIGRPIANSLMYVLGEWQEEAPIGATGEIYIGGSGVARGYQGEAEKSAERFVPNPYSGARGDRMYRTGDLGRWRGDGKLEYVGRRDHQVKVRGYRIELGEVETALREVSGVREAVVLAREDEGGAKRLVAYVVGEVEAEEVGRCLRSRLPEYMAPSVYVWMEEMPLTANGKVDRERLPAPGEVKGERRRARVERGRGEIEEIMRGIWEEVLRVEEVGDEENFFELGGHSLLATQVVSRVREVFGAEVGLRSVFESPTVVGMVKELERALRGEDEETGPPPLRRVGRDGETPLSFAQQRLWFLDQLEPGSAAYNIAYAIRVEGELNLPALRQSLNTIMARHEALRTRFEMRDGKPAQVIDERAEIDILVCHLDSVNEDEREQRIKRLAEQDAERPFDLERGPVWRATLAQLGAKDHALLLCMHHVVSDGWSISVLSREFTALYEGYSKGQNVTLPELPIQYADFAVWQREWLQGETLERHLGYWRDQLSGAPTLDMPADRPRSIVARRRGAKVQFVLSSEIIEQIKQMSRREGVTLFMTLVAGFKIVLGRYTGQEDLVIGTDVANRNRLETEGLIGFFVNQLALRTDLSGDPSFREILRRVRRVVLDAYGRQDVPFEKVVDEVAPERRADRSPLFQVKLVLQNIPDNELHSSDLTINSLGVNDSTSKFDILLNLFETAEGLVGYNQYDSDLFDSSTMQGLLRFYEAALSVIATGGAMIDLPKSALLRAINQRAGSLLTQRVGLGAYLRRSPVA
jgi:amino acid adenylation domain-containing protein